MILIKGQIVDNDHRSYLVKFGKIHHSLFEYLNEEVGPNCPLKSKVDSCNSLLGW